MAINISDEERKVDYAIAEHANNRYNYWLGIRNQNKRFVGGTSVDEKPDKHQRVHIQLAEKYGVTCLAGELLLVIRGEKVPVQTD